MIKSNLITTTYDTTWKAIKVDIVLDPDADIYEAWMYSTNYGVKNFIIGVPVNQDTGYTSMNDFIGLVESMLRDSVYDYIEMVEKLNQI